MFQGLTAGDCNGSHAVDTGDLAIMGGNWNKTGKVWADGDFTNDGKVDTGDLALMGGNWNWTKPLRPRTSAGSVPEPATLSLLVLGALGLLRRKRT